MNTNIYSADVGAPVASEASQLWKSLLEQQVAAAKALRSPGEYNCISTPFAVEYLVEMQIFTHEIC